MTENASLFKPFREGARVGSFDSAAFWPYYMGQGTVNSFCFPFCPNCKKISIQIQISTLGAINYEELCCACLCEHYPCSELLREGLEGQGMAL